jgi:hypothetical protein
MCLILIGVSDRENYLYLHHNGGHCVVQALYDYQGFKETTLDDPGHGDSLDGSTISREEYEAFHSQFVQEQLNLTTIEKELGVTAWNADIDLPYLPCKPCLVASTFEKFLVEQFFLGLTERVRQKSVSGLPAQLKEYVTWIMQL